VVLGIVLLGEFEPILQIGYLAHAHNQNPFTTEDLTTLGNVTPCPSGTGRLGIAVATGPPLLAGVIEQIQSFDQVMELHDNAANLGVSEAIQGLDVEISVANGQVESTSCSRS